LTSFWTPLRPPIFGRPGDVPVLFPLGIQVVFKNMKVGIINKYLNGCSMGDFLEDFFWLKHDWLGDIDIPW